VHVSDADAPFWMVLGESQSDGWKATVTGRGSLGTSRLVDGHANGWLVQPDRASFDIVMEWTPQRQVWAAIWVSLAAALLCLALVAWSMTRGRRAIAVIGDSPSDADVRIEWPSQPRGVVVRTRGSRVLVPILAGLVATLVVAPWAGLLAAAAAALVQWRPAWRVLVAVIPAALLAIVLVYMVYLQHHFRFPPVFEWPTLFPFGRPLGWLAVVFLGVDVLVERAQTPAPGAAAAGSTAEHPGEM
jgi:arabinofuranan 3-O-arabinosyltransferase